MPKSSPRTYRLVQEQELSDSEVTANRAEDKTNEAFFCVFPANKSEYVPKVEIRL
jgi:hypothetical protein